MTSVFNFTVYQNKTWEKGLAIGLCGRSPNRGVLVVCPGSGVLIFRCPGSVSLYLGVLVASMSW